jgi:hypothetical protein
LDGEELVLSPTEHKTFDLAKAVHEQVLAQSSMKKFSADPVSACVERR